MLQEKLQIENNTCITSQRLTVFGLKKIRKKENRFVEKKVVFKWMKIFLKPLQFFYGNVKKNTKQTDTAKHSLFFSKIHVVFFHRKLLNTSDKRSNDTLMAIEQTPFYLN